MRLWLSRADYFRQKSFIPGHHLIFLLFRRKTLRRSARNISLVAFVLLFSSCSQHQHYFAYLKVLLFFMISKIFCILLSSSSPAHIAVCCACDEESFQCSASVSSSLRLQKTLFASVEFFVWLFYVREILVELIKIVVVKLSIRLFQESVYQCITIIVTALMSPRTG